MKTIPVLLVLMIAASGMARAGETLRLLPPRPGLWDLRTEVTSIEPDAQRPGIITRKLCEMAVRSVPDPFWAEVDMNLVEFGADHPFSVNTPVRASAGKITDYTRATALYGDGGRSVSLDLDIRRLSDRAYIQSVTSTESQHGKWLFTRREVTRLRWLTRRVPKPDPRLVELENSGLYDPGVPPCRPIKARKK